MDCRDVKAEFEAGVVLCETHKVKKDCKEVSTFIANRAAAEVIELHLRER